MLVYFIIFFITCFSCFLVQKFDKNKAAVIIFSILSIIIPSYFAGMRDFTVGIDILVYGKRFFLIATSYSNFVNYYKNINSPIGYALLNFIISRFTNNVNVFLFIHQIIINLLMYLVIYKNRDKVPMWLSMFTYLLMFYCRTFNFIKQSISLAIIIYGIKYIREKKLLKYTICVLIASTFHTTALIAILLYILNYFCNKKNSIFYLYSIMMSIIFVLIFIPEIISLLYSMSLLEYRYYIYILIYVRERFTIDYGGNIFRIFFIILYFLVINRFNKYDNMSKLYGASLIIDLILFNMKNTLLYTERLAYYFGYVYVLFLPQIPKIICKNKSQKILINILLCTLLLIYWYYYFVMRLDCEIYPYTSSILGI